ncbi:MAG: adenylate/guanylate cyclase domain-containing protein [Proteobacteria bacterium]|nr:adenylate/guanylate cyclase domain-containing protein [Pseudomonadota bacterium]MDA1057602.1 adenylate/guanylate cyclase domain-containing protein [Pseudomonadota bacterium]
MLLLFAMDIGIHVFFGLVTQRWLIVLSNVPLQLTMFLGVNLWGAGTLYRPIAKYLDGTGDLADAIRRIQRLPQQSAILAFAIVCPTVAVNAIVIPSMFFAEDFALIPLGTILSRVAIWWVLLPYFIYFLVTNFTADLRTVLFEARGIVVPARSGRLLTRLIIAFCVAAFLPGGVMFVDSLGLQFLAESLGIEPYVILGSDLFVTFAIFAITFPVIASTFQRPINKMKGAVAALQRGDLTAKTPVQTDDELGLLAQSYNEMIDGLRERELVRETFGRFVNPQIARTILDHPERLSGEVREATVLFTDIEGFTTVTEAMSPTDTINLLNEYFEVVMEPVSRHGGVITNFTGDSLLAVFNVPEADPDHAANAVRAALEIERQLNGRTFGAGLAMRTRIGINTGDVVAGAVGGSDRLGYTILGDAVNLAARLEQLNKQYGSLIMVSEETARRAGTGFRFEPIGDITVKGRAKTVRAFTVAVE